VRVCQKIRCSVWGFKGGVFRAVQARELFGRYGVPGAMGRAARGAWVAWVAWVAWRVGVGQCQNAKDPRKAGLV